MKFWYYIEINSSIKHPDWKTIYFIGTVSSLKKVGLYSFDNSSSDSESFIWIEKQNSNYSLGDYWYNTDQQYAITKSTFNVTKFSKSYISGTYSATATRKNGETISFNGYFDDLDVR